METKQFLHALDDQQIAEAITVVEKLTSGEIRVFVSEQSVDEPVLEAEKQFARLGMTKTAQRNGVVIYFAPKS
ncbi:MAG: TPM domain-containing protein, partial [Limisphaerales bacterium]